MRARRKRDANAERKRCLERRRLKEAEAVRIKHEGASKAELVSKRAVLKAMLRRVETAAGARLCCLFSPLLCDTLFSCGGFFLCDTLLSGGGILSIGHTKLALKNGATR